MRRTSANNKKSQEKDEDDNDKPSLDDELSNSVEEDES